MKRAADATLTWAVVEQMTAFCEQYVHHEVEARMTATTVEILLQRRVIAVHARSYVQGGFTTITEHMPSAHRAHAEWTPSRILTWAGKVGTSTHDLCSVILQSRPHPEQGFRSCLGILRLAKRYGDARLEAACARALRAGARSYRHVDSILKHGLDRVLVNEADPPTRPITHENVRGRDFYH